LFETGRRAIHFEGSFAAKRPGRWQRSSESKTVSIHPVVHNTGAIPDDYELFQTNSLSSPRQIDRRPLSVPWSVPHNLSVRVRLIGSTLWRGGSRPAGRRNDSGISSTGNRKDRGGLFRNDQVRRRLEPGEAPFSKGVLR